jgi:putative transposase
MGQLRSEVAEIIKKVCELIGVQLIRGGICKDHVHLYLSIAPKMSISTVMSKKKGKSALMIFDRHPEMRGKLGRHFWARGYYVETVGDVNEEAIKEYIRLQEESDQILG